MTAHAGRPGYPRRQRTQHLRQLDRKLTGPCHYLQVVMAKLNRIATNDELSVRISIGIATYHDRRSEQRLSLIADIASIDDGMVKD